MKSCLLSSIYIYIYSIYFYIQVYTSYNILPVETTSAFRRHGFNISIFVDRCFSSEPQNMEEILGKYVVECCGIWLF